MMKLIDSILQRKAVFGPKAVNKLKAVNKRKAVPALSFFVLCLIAPLSHAALPAFVDGQPLPSLAPMLEKVQGSVVNISTEAEIRLRRRVDPFFDDPFFRRFFGQNPQQRRQSQKRQGLGSGVVFNADKGLILTNAHVIDGADKITVTLKDGREAIASVIGADKETDVAIIAIELDNLNEAPLGNSDELRVGDFVVAIGNPFGLRQTVTSGIVSALGRSGLGIEKREDFIQTDASINPGNSGGALLNLRGELIGINTAIVAPGGGNVGIGFSIPINMALQIKNQIVQYGKVQRGRVGIRVQDLTPSLADAFGIDQRRGAVITRIEQGSMADLAGVKTGDVVVYANGREISKGADLHTVIGLLRVGDELRLQVLRNGETKFIQTTIGGLESDSQQGAKLNSRLEGAAFSEMNDQQLSDGAGGGVIISDVKRGSSAWYHGMRPNDIIVSVNRRPVKSLDNFHLAVANNQVLRFYILRGNRALFLLLQ